MRPARPAGQICGARQSSFDDLSPVMYMAGSQPLNNDGEQKIGHYWIPLGSYGACKLHQFVLKRKQYRILSRKFTIIHEFGVYSRQYRWNQENQRISVDPVCVRTTDYVFCTLYKSPKSSTFMETDWGRAYHMSLTNVWTPWHFQSLQCL